MSNYEFGPPRHETIQEEFVEGYALKYGDLCPGCRNDVIAEGEELCAACLDEVFPSEAVA